MRVRLGSEGEAVSEAGGWDKIRIRLTSEMRHGFRRMHEAREGSDFGSTAKASVEVLAESIKHYLR